MNNFSEIEGGSTFNSQFLKHSQYSPFINPRILYLRRLYFMISLQLCVCLAVSLCVRFFEDVKKFFVDHHYLFIVCGVLALLMMVFGYLLHNKVSGVPKNWIFFILFTIFFSLFIAYLIAISKSKYSVMGLVTAVMLSISLYLYSLTTKIQLSYHGASLYVLGASFLSLELCLIFTDAEFMFLLLMSLGLGVCAFYVIYATQTTMQGVGLNFEEKDWIVSSCTIYFEVFLITLLFAERLGDIITKERN